MQLGVSSYSFWPLIQAGKMDHLDLIAKASEMGFDVVEFAAFLLPEGETPLSYAPKVKAECDRVGIKVANYAIAADFLSGSEGNLDAEIQRIQDQVRVAEMLEAPMMRHDATIGFPPDHQGPQGFTDALPRLAAGCRAVTEFAAQRGIQTLVENHGFFCQNSERLEQLANAVDHPNFGLLADMGNFLCVDESPPEALGRLMPHIRYCHVKDFHVKYGGGYHPGEGWFCSRGGNFLRGAIIGHGEVPVHQCLRVMKKAQYDGVVSVEFEGMEDAIRGIEIGFANLKRSIAVIYDG